MLNITMNKINIQTFSNSEFINFLDNKSKNNNLFNIGNACLKNAILNSLLDDESIIRFIKISGNLKSIPDHFYKHNNTPLIFAILKNRTTLAEFIIDHYGTKCHPDHMNAYGETALSCALQNNNLHIVYKLLDRFDKKCLPNNFNCNVDSLMYWAIENDHFDIIDNYGKILEANCVNKQGNTPLILSCKKGLLNIAINILNNYFDTCQPLHKNNENLSALDYSLNDNDMQEFTVLFIEKCYKLYGNTLVTDCEYVPHLASKYGLSHIVKQYYGTDLIAHNDNWSVVDAAIVFQNYNLAIDIVKNNIEYDNFNTNVNWEIAFIDELLLCCDNTKFKKLQCTDLDAIKSFTTLYTKLKDQDLFSTTMNKISSDDMSKLVLYASNYVSNNNICVNFIVDMIKLFKNEFFFNNKILVNHFLCKNNKQRIGIIFSQFDFLLTETKFFINFANNVSDKNEQFIINYLCDEVKKLASSSIVDTKSILVCDIFKSYFSLQLFDVFYKNEFHVFQLANNVCNFILDNIDDTKISIINLIIGKYPHNYHQIFDIYSFTNPITFFNAVLFTKYKKLDENLLIKLLNDNIFTNKDNCINCILLAIEMNFNKLVRQIIQNPKCLPTIDKCSFGIILCCVDNGKYDIIELLIDMDNKHNCDCVRDELFFFMEDNFDVGVLSLLIKYDKYRIDAIKSTKDYLICSQDNNALKIILNNENVKNTFCSVTSFDFTKPTPEYSENCNSFEMEMCTIQNEKSILKILQHDNDILQAHATYKNKDGDTLLSLACQNKMVDLIDYLIIQKFDVRSANNYNVAPLDIIVVNELYQSLTTILNVSNNCINIINKLIDYLQVKFDYGIYKVLVTANIDQNTKVQLSKLLDIHIHKLGLAFDEKMVCMICCNKNSQRYVLFDCMHVLNIDADCLAKIKNCPICRQKIFNYLRVYLA